MERQRVAARLWAKVVHGAADECWHWSASGVDGYGRLRVAGRMVMAHRVAYELEVGEIPAGLQLDHLCRRRSCVNPRHLDPVTASENIRRRILKTREPECLAA